MGTMFMFAPKPYISYAHTQNEPELLKQPGCWRRKLWRSYLRYETRGMDNESGFYNNPEVKQHNVISQLEKRLVIGTKLRLYLF